MALVTHHLLAAFREADAVFGEAHHRRYGNTQRRPGYEAAESTLALRDPLAIAAARRRVRLRMWQQAGYPLTEPAG